MQRDTDDDVSSSDFSEISGSDSEGENHRRKNQQYFTYDGSLGATETANEYRPTKRPLSPSDNNEYKTIGSEDVTHSESSPTKQSKLETKNTDDVMKEEEMGKGERYLPIGGVTGDMEPETESDVVMPVPNIAVEELEKAYNDKMEEELDKTTDPTSRVEIRKQYGEQLKIQRDSLIKSQRLFLLKYPEYQRRLASAPPPPPNSDTSSLASQSSEDTVFERRPLLKADDMELRQRIRGVITQQPKSTKIAETSFNDPDGPRTVPFDPAEETHTTTRARGDAGTTTSRAAGLATFGAIANDAIIKVSQEYWKNKFLVDNQHIFHHVSGASVYIKWKGKMKWTEDHDEIMKFYDMDDAQRDKYFNLSEKEAKQDPKGRPWPVGMRPHHQKKIPGLSKEFRQGRENLDPDRPGLTPRQRLQILGELRARERAAAANPTTDTTTTTGQW